MVIIYKKRNKNALKNYKLICLLCMHSLVCIETLADNQPHEQLGF